MSRRLPKVPQPAVMRTRAPAHPMHRYILGAPSRNGPNTNIWSLVALAPTHYTTSFRLMVRVHQTYHVFIWEGCACVNRINYIIRIVNYLTIANAMAIAPLRARLFYSVLPIFSRG